MANIEDNEFWKDELFFESQDPLMRSLEQKRHPDTGKRITIVDGLVLETISKAIINEASKRVEVNTRILTSNTNIFSES